MRKGRKILRIALVLFAVAIAAASQPATWVPIQKPGGGQGWYLDPADLTLDDASTDCSDGEGLVASSGAWSCGALDTARVVTVCATGCDYADLSDALAYVEAQSGRGSASRWTVEAVSGQYDEAAPLSVPTWTTLKGVPSHQTQPTINPSAILRFTDPQPTSGTYLTLGQGSALDSVYVYNQSAPTATAAVYLVDLANSAHIYNSNVYFTAADGAFQAGSVYCYLGCGSIVDSTISAANTIDGSSSGAIVLGSLAARTIRLKGSEIKALGDSPAIYSGHASAAIHDYGGNVISAAVASVPYDIATVGGSYLVQNAASTYVAGEVMGTSDGGSAVPVQAGAIPTCNAAYGVGFTVDQTGDLCFCDGSSWRLIDGGGACA